MKIKRKCCEIYQKKKIVGRQREKERESLQVLPAFSLTPSSVECRSVAEISISFILHIYIRRGGKQVSYSQTHFLSLSTGFAGELCNFEYNECESNPCQNAGECIDHIGSFECRCTKGYTGNRCQIKVSAKECQIA